MSVTLKINNFPEANIQEKTYLPQGVLAGATALNVENAANISINLYAYVGVIGDDSSELRAITAINSNALTVAAMTNTHDKLDPVIILKYNQIKIYRASNVDGSTPADGSFSVLTTVNIDTDDVQTTYTDDVTGSSYWYKSILYNSLTSTGTALADSTAYRGGGYTEYAKIVDIRRKAGLSTNKWVTDEMIDEKRQAAQQVINSVLSGIYTLPFTDPINPVIAECTRLLTAGYLLTDNYGPLQTLNTNEGQQMIDRVMNDKGTGLLDKLNTKQLVLTSSTGADTSIPGTGDSFTGWPNSDTKDADPEDGGAERKFRMSDRY